MGCESVKGNAIGTPVDQTPEEAYRGERNAALRQFAWRAFGSVCAVTLVIGSITAAAKASYAATGSEGWGAIGGLAMLVVLFFLTMFLVDLVGNINKAREKAGKLPL